MIEALSTLAFTCASAIRSCSSTVHPCCRGNTPASGIAVDLVLSGPGLEELFFQRSREQLIDGVRVPVASHFDRARMSREHELCSALHTAKSLASSRVTTANPRAIAVAAINRSRSPTAVRLPARPRRARADARPRDRRTEQRAARATARFSGRGFGNRMNNSNYSVGTEPHLRTPVAPARTPHPYHGS